MAEVLATSMCIFCECVSVYLGKLEQLYQNNVITFFDWGERVTRRLLTYSRSRASVFHGRTSVPPSTPPLPPFFLATGPKVDRSIIANVESYGPRVIRLFRIPLIHQILFFRCGKKYMPPPLSFRYPFLFYSPRRDSVLQALPNSLCGLVMYANSHLISMRDRRGSQRTSPSFVGG